MPHFDRDGLRVAVVERSVIVRKAGRDLELSEDELRWLCVTAGPAALSAIEALRRARGTGPGHGAGASQAPSNTEG